MAMLIVRERRVKQKALYKNNAVSVADTLYPKVTPTSSLLHACADDALGCRIAAYLHPRFIPSARGQERVRYAARHVAEHSHVNLLIARVVRKDNGCGI
jgi:hypothetical protein